MGIILTASTYYVWVVYGRRFNRVPSYIVLAVGNSNVRHD